MAARTHPAEPAFTTASEKDVWQRIADPVWRVVAMDEPRAVLDPHVAALDLHHNDPRVGHQHNKIGLVVLVGVGDPDVREHHTVGPQLPDHPATQWSRPTRPPSGHPAVTLDAGLLAEQYGVRVLPS